MSVGYFAAVRPGGLATIHPLLPPQAGSVGATLTSGWLTNTASSPHRGAPFKAYIRHPVSGVQIDVVENLTSRKSADGLEWHWQCAAWSPLLTRGQKYEVRWCRTDYPAHMGNGWEIIEAT